jgi:hypothetical protein
VEALRSALGSGGTISLAVGLGFLHVAHVELPPVPRRERAGMLALEPERYFAEREVPLVVALAGDGDLGFGAPRDLVERWIAAFEEWGPVARVEPGPLAAVRALGRSASGVFEMDAGDGERGLIDVRDGALRSARRMPAGGTAGTDATALPRLRGLDMRFLVALGAARGADDALDGILAPGETAARLAARRRRGIAISCAAAGAALLFALWSADAWRGRTLHALEERSATLEARAAPATAAMRSLLTLQTEAETIRRLSAERPDPFGALAALGRALPRDAVVLSARAAGDDWQLEGTARDASVLVPVLDRDARIDSVHFLSASSRYREANRSYETFSVALRYRSRP